MSNYKTRSFQTPEVNWLGNWSSNESLNSKEQSFVKTSSICRQSVSPNKIRFVIEPQNKQLVSQLPPKSSPRNITHSPTPSNSAYLQRTYSNSNDKNYHKLENRNSFNNVDLKPGFRTYSTTNSPSNSTLISANFDLKSCNNQNLNRNSVYNSSQPSPRKNSFCDSQSQLSNHSVSRAKYEDFRNLRSTRSYTPTIVIESNRNTPGRTVSIIINKRNNKVLFFSEYILSKKLFSSSVYRIKKISIILINIFG